MIAFESERDGNREILVMNADGGAPRNLTDVAAADAGPDWQAVEAVLQPDLAIAPDGSLTFVGLHEHGQGQTLRAAGIPGARQRFTLRLTNDGNVSDRLTVRGARQGPGFTARYLHRGSET